MTEVDIKRLSADIMQGKYDGQLDQLLGAVRHRFSNGPGVMRWAMKHEGPEFTVEVTEDDLTIGEARAVEKATRLPWGLIDPVKSADCCAALMATVVETRHGKAADEAMKYVESLPMAEVVESITSYEVVPGPFDSTTPETP